jgi:hypothetical protein
MAKLKLLKSPFDRHWYTGNSGLMSDVMPPVTMLVDPTHSGLERG